MSQSCQGQKTKGAITDNSSGGCIETVTETQPRRCEATTICFSVFASICSAKDLLTLELMLIGEMQTDDDIVICIPNK